MYQNTGIGLTVTLDQFTVTVTVKIVTVYLCYSLHISTVMQYRFTCIVLIMLSNPKGNLKVVCVNICRSL